MHAELSTRGSTCVVRTNGLQSDVQGFGFVVPSPWRWPLEGVPIYLDAAHAIGQCVEGGNGGEPCAGKDECPGGYCDAPSLMCFDAFNEDGLSVYHKCTKSAQCPYGTCYGYMGSTQLGAYPHFAEWLECRAAGCYQTAGGADPLCALGNCHEPQVAAWWRAGASADLFAMSASTKK